MEISVSDLNGSNWSKGKLIANATDSFRILEELEGLWSHP